MVYIMRDAERTSRPDDDTTQAAHDGNAPDGALCPHAFNDVPGATLATSAPPQTQIGDGRADPRREARFTVLLFASLKDAAQAGHIDVRVSAPPGAAVTVADVLAQCGRQYPRLAPWLPHVRVAVNCEYSDVQQPLEAGDEIAFLPPVSGGADRRLICAPLLNLAL
jgi:molybdopterin converting factor small subunit